jgi:hypothetical protein
MPDVLHRWGGGGSFEYGLGSGASLFGGKSLAFVYGDFSYAGGRADASARAEIGQGGVTAIALTFGRPDPVFGTGVFAATPGFGLTGQGKLSNEWAIGNFGYGQTFTLGDQPDSPAVILRTGLYIEGLGFDSKGKTKVTFNGAPFSGFYQRYRLNTDDLYGGVSAGLDYQFFPLDGLSITVGGEVNLAYHWGSLKFRQSTGVGGGAVVRERIDLDNSGFVVGGGLKVEADYAFAKDWTVGVSYSLSVLPDVTGVEMRENPAAPELGLRETDVVRHFVGMRIQRTF